MNEEDLRAKTGAGREAGREHDEEIFQMWKGLFVDSVVTIILIISAVIFAGLKVAAIIFAIALLFTVARVDINMNKE